MYSYFGMQSNVSALETTELNINKYIEQKHSLRQILLAVRGREHLPQALEGEAVLELLDADSELGAVDGLPVPALHPAVRQVGREHVRRLGVTGVDLVYLVHGLMSSWWIVGYTLIQGDPSGG